MTGIPLSAALQALEKDLHRSFPEVTTVEVELGLVPTADGDRVRWDMAAPGTPAAHRVRFVVRLGQRREADHPWPADSPRSTPISDTTVFLDPNIDLPPIVRPKPGLREDDVDD